MLNNISVENFLLVDQVKLDLKSGFTVITGETGSGKSMIIDALSLALGERASQLKNDTQASKITLNFSLEKNKIPHALEKKLSSLDFKDKLIIQREIGKRKSLKINNHNVKLADIKAISNYLVFIHEQNDHTILKSTEQHREIIDQFTDIQPQLKNIAEIVEEYSELKNKYDKITLESAGIEKHIEWLKFQIEEMEQLGDMSEEEITQLEQEYLLLSNSKDLVSQVEYALNELIQDENGINERLSKMISAIEKQNKIENSKLDNALELLENANIQIAESQGIFQDFLDDLSFSAEYLQSIEKQYDKLIQISQKHNIAIQELPQLYLKLTNEFEEFTGKGENSVANMLLRVEQLSQEYHILANEISLKRMEAGNQIDQKVNELLFDLGLSHCMVNTRMLQDTNKISKLGYDDVIIYLSTNPKLPMQPIQNVASGGEMARITLAFQVALIQQSPYQKCLIFDEIDVGFGGSTSEVVGRFLLDLAQKGNQVIIISHQAQMAAIADYQIKVSQQNNNIIWQYLNYEERVEEVARMMAGQQINKEAYDHAKALIRINPNNSKNI